MAANVKMPEGPLLLIYIAAEHHLQDGMWASRLPGNSWCRLKHLQSEAALAELKHHYPDAWDEYCMTEGDWKPC